MVVVFFFEAVQYILESFADHPSFSDLRSYHMDHTLPTVTPTQLRAENAQRLPPVSVPTTYSLPCRTLDGLAPRTTAIPTYLPLPRIPLPVHPPSTPPVAPLARSATTPVPVNLSPYPARHILPGMSCRPRPPQPSHQKPARSRDKQEPEPIMKTQAARAAAGVAAFVRPITPPFPREVGLPAAAAAASAPPSMHACIHT